MTNILISACLLGVCCKYNGGSNACGSVRRLMERGDICLIPVCPEQLGGLPTPRVPSERQGDRVISKDGTDVTVQYHRGAEEALKIAELYGCAAALLKERSPSCGIGKIYDGTFSGTLTAGDGIAAERLRLCGIPVFGESQADELAAMLDNGTSGGKEFKL